MKNKSDLVIKIIIVILIAVFLIGKKYLINTQEGAVKE